MVASVQLRIPVSSERSLNIHAVLTRASRVPYSHRLPPTWRLSTCLLRGLHGRDLPTCSRPTADDDAGDVLGGGVNQGRSSGKR